ncbi:MAG: metal ABC transporter permease [Candidatus Methanofastidiosia archaeon]
MPHRDDSTWHAAQGIGGTLMIELFHYEFMRNALLAGTLASVICGIIGVYVVLKRIVFISGGIAHSSFGGIGLGYLLGINPMITTLLFSLLSALCIGAIKQKIKLHEDTTIGILWATGMALGIIFIGLSKGYAPDLFGYLFGNILAVSSSDLTIMFGLSIFIILIVALFFKEFLVLSFDEEFGKTVGVPTEYVYFLLLCLIALTVVILIKIVGIILVIALLTIPAATSRLVTSSVKKMMLISILIGAFSALCGLVLSYYKDLASGATIVLISTIIFFVLSLCKGIVDRRLNISD